jgi:hypothetical protein
MLKKEKNSKKQNFNLFLKKEKSGFVGLFTVSKFPLTSEQTKKCRFPSYVCFSQANPPPEPSGGEPQVVIIQVVLRQVVISQVVLRQVVIRTRLQVVLQVVIFQNLLQV